MGYKILLILIVLAFAVVIFILWNNPAAEKSTTHLGTLGGALLLIVITAYPFLQKDIKKEFSNFIVFRDNKTDQLVGGAPDGPYNKIYGPALTGIAGSTAQVSYDIRSNDEKDAIERAIVLQLISDFENADWDADAVSFHVPYNSGVATVFVSSGIPTTILKSKTLASIFSGNRYLKDEVVYANRSIRLPPNTTIKRISNSATWTIIIENPDFKLTISSYGSSSLTLPGGAWGIFHGDTAKYRYAQRDYKLMVIGETKWGKRYTDLTTKYWTWYTNMVKSVKTFDWENVDKQLIDKFQRDSIWH